ncbi:MAG TPA: UDP-N-acetylmuramoyl-L-alanine--D-glutamate ligase [Herpetosiphonaceae bacterium]
MELRGKRALVMGLGVHGGGLGVTRFLAEQGARVTVTDLRSAEQLAPTLEQLRDVSVEYVLGQHREADFRNTDIVIRNPGVPRESPYLQIAREAGAAVEMEMTLFFRLCPAPIIGITGTKGKTTTTLLTGAMLKQQFPDTVVAGNLRVSALAQLPRIGPRSPVVLELSSWQLEGLGEAGLSPRFACVTNISADHLDRYPSMASYIEAKRQIFLHQGSDGLVVLNMNDATVAEMASRAPGHVAWFAGHYGEFGEAFARKHPHDLMVAWNNRFLFWQDKDSTEIVVGKPEVQLPGKHNLQNIAAATALAVACGVKAEHIRTAIQRFSGVPDRLELVRELHGVRYINDTTATTPTAAIMALRSVDAPKIMIVGGADKRLDFMELARVLLKRAKAVVLLKGDATNKLLVALDAARLNLQSQWSEPLGPFDNLRAAVEAAQAMAEPGDAVVLSPGCASFGMFRNEFDRGEQFRQIVRSLS